MVVAEICLPKVSTNDSSNYTQAGLVGFEPILTCSAGTLLFHGTGLIALFIILFWVQFDERYHVDTIIALWPH